MKNYTMAKLLKTFYLFKGKQLLAILHEESKGLSLKESTDFPYDDIAQAVKELGYNMV